VQLNEAIQEMRDHAKMIILAVNAAVEQQVELINKRGVMATYACGIVKFSNHLIN
jgi:hypothetical protein